MLCDVKLTEGEIRDIMSNIDNAIQFFADNCNMYQGDRVSVVYHATNEAINYLKGRHAYFQKKLEGFE